MKENKDILLNNLRLKIINVQNKVIEEKKRVQLLANKSVSEIKSMMTHDQTVYLNLKRYTEDRLAELSNLYQSPFFVKCEIVYKKTKKPATLYFAKHTLTEEEIYSWVSPISTIRFENPGPVSYQLPNGNTEKIDILKKEKYMIIDGRVLSFSTEGLNEQRELIYQEHFKIR